MEANVNPTKGFLFSQSFLIAIHLRRVGFTRSLALRLRQLVKQSRLFEYVNFGFGEW